MHWPRCLARCLPTSICRRLQSCPRPRSCLPFWPRNCWRGVLTSLPARAAYFPSLTLSASTGYRASELSNLLSAPNLFWSLGPALALSLFDGGARSAAVESARAQLDLTSATYRQTVITALQEVEDNLVVADSLSRELTVQTEAAAAARKSLTVANNQYKAGIVAYLNVLSAQTTVLSAERSLIDLRNRRLVAVNTLLKNVAGSWDAR